MMGWWKTKNGCLGDGPADTMALAVKEIKIEYQRAWKRNPSEVELFDVLKFIMGNSGAELGAFNPVNEARAKKLMETNPGRKFPANLIPGIDSSESSEPEPPKQATEQPESDGEASG